MSESDTSTAGQRVAIRLPAKAAKAAETTIGLAGPPNAGDKLVLAETADRDRFELRRGDEILGRARQHKDSIAIELAEHKLTATPDGKDVVLTEGADQLARYEDRLLRANRVLLADGVGCPFDGELLKGADGAPLATFQAQNPNSGSRVVRIEILDATHATTELIAFVAVVTLIQRLPGLSANRFGGGGAKAGDSLGVSSGGGL